MTSRDVAGASASAQTATGWRSVRAVLIGVICLATFAVSNAKATGAPSPSTPTPGTAQVPAAADSGRAIAPRAYDSRVHIVKDLSGPSCTGYSSQSATPSTIRVMVHGRTPTTDQVVTVPFQQYVENVLPNEWIASWDGAALEAGAVAVKSYAWYWVIHFGGYLDTRGNCFDVTDDTDFQVYRAGSAVTSTNSAVQATWSVVARKSNQILQASYICTLPFTYGSTNCGTQGPRERCGAGANGAQLSQWGSQACAQAGKTYQDILTTYYGTSLQLFTTTSVPRQLLMPDDFTLSGRSAPAVWDPVTGVWTLSSISGKQYQWGVSGDIPTVTNKGNGRALIGIWRPADGLWYIKDVLSGAWSKTQWGERGDIPVQAHYRGIDQPTVLATFRPSDGRWYLNGGGTATYGQAGDVPVPGHYAGSAANHYADQFAVWRPSTGQWYITGPIRVQWGIKGDIPVPADYNGDGKTDIAVYRPATQRWYVLGTPSFRWGLPGDIPVTGDFNGDGKADFAVFRPSDHRWYIRGQVSPVFGSGRSFPVGEAPYTD